MEEDDEIQSPASAGSPGSPASPRPNGRITVTVAVAPSQQATATVTTPAPESQKMLTLALPSQVQKSSGGGREDCWSEGATAVLIEAWGERYLELSRGNLKQKHWKEVADIVSSREDYTKNPKTDIQCKNRIDTVKKKYKSEKSKIAAGGGPSKWAFYDRLDQLIGPAAAKVPPSGSAAAATAQKLPLGMPVVGVRGASSQFLRQRDPKHQQQQVQKIKIRRQGPVDSDSDSDSSREASPASTDSVPVVEVFEQKKRRRTGREANASGMVRGGGGGGDDGGAREKGGWGSSVRELTRAILKFGETYEHAESAKLQQVVEMEKQRMKFAKELELQRMQFFVKTQVEISQLKLGGRRRSGAGNASNHHSNNNNNNNSDCSN